MKKNLYYREVFRRKNHLGEAILNFFYRFCSLPRLMLEVFIRRNFGERYFSTAAVVTIVVFLILFPPLTEEITEFFTGSPMGRFDSPEDYENYRERRGKFFRGDYATWHLFTVAFIFCAVLRFREMRRRPSVFDFGHFSLSTGEFHPIFQKLFGRKPNPRDVEILYEPLLFLAPGLLLWAMGQKLGVLLTWSSVFYCLSYFEAYRRSDEFVMDKIDEMILNEETHRAFIEDEDPGNTRGVRFYADKPTDKALRERLADSFIVDDEEPTFAN